MIDRLRKQLDADLADLRAAKAAARTERQAATEAEENLAAAQEAQAILQQTAEQTQNVVHSRIASVVTRCLEAVWGDAAYSFRIEFVRKRGRTEADIALVRGGNAVDPLDGAGGGVCDVCAFSLAIASIMLARPRLRKLYVGDETFKHLSADRRPAAREMLLALARDLGFQMVFATHAKELCVGRVIELE